MNRLKPRSLWSAVDKHSCARSRIWLLAGRPLYPTAAKNVRLYDNNESGPLKEGRSWELSVMRFTGATAFASGIFIGRSLKIF
jgi:hypothetical protein